jgi:hypothetical protein
VSPVDLGQKSTWRPNAHTVVGLALTWLLIADVGASWALAGILLAAVAGWLKRTP